MPKIDAEPKTPRDCATLMLSHVCEAYRRAQAGGHGAAASLEKARRTLTEMLRQAHEDVDGQPKGAYAHTGTVPPSLPIQVGDAAITDLGLLIETLKLATLLTQELRTTIWTYEAAEATRVLRQQMGVVVMRAMEFRTGRAVERPAVAGRIGMLTAKVGGI